MKDENHTRLLHIHWTLATIKNYATLITSYRTSWLYFATTLVIKTTDAIVRVILTSHYPESIMFGMK